MGKWGPRLPLKIQNPANSQSKEGQLVHSPTLFTNMVSLRSWGRVGGVSRLGAVALAPLAPSPQGGSGRSQRCVGLGEPDAPQKRTLHLEGSHGRSHTELSLCKRKYVAGWGEGTPIPDQASAIWEMVVFAVQAERRYLNCWMDV